MHLRLEMSLPEKWQVLKSGAHGIPQNVGLFVQGTCVEPLACTLEPGELWNQLSSYQNLSLLNDVSAVEGAINCAACGSSFKN